MKTTKEERMILRAEVANGDTPAMIGSHCDTELLDLLDDADRCEELEAAGYTRGACWECGDSLNAFYGVCLGCHKQRIDELEREIP